MDHEPVLLESVIEGLHIKNQGKPAFAKATAGKYIDATLGTGGYAKAIIERGGSVLGIDFDPTMLIVARKNLRVACPDSFYKLVNGNFTNIKEIAKENGFNEVDGIVFDLGVSNVHFKDTVRGFSFREPNAQLDMRLNLSSQEVKASDLLNSLRSDQLEELFLEVLDKPVAKRISKQIVKARAIKKIETVGDFLKIVNRVFIPARKLHPATKAFLALRIAVNSELDNLRKALPDAFSLLKKNGRLAVVAFHSLEDVIVKNYFRDLVLANKAKLITKKPVVPSVIEVRDNPKSRSAKLRIILKL